MPGSMLSSFRISGFLTSNPTAVAINHRFDSPTD